MMGSAAAEDRRPLAETAEDRRRRDRPRHRALLGSCRQVSIARASTEEIRTKRYFHRQKIKKQNLPPFFVGEITYRGEFSREIMALLELGRFIHVGKMATFGNGMYEVEV